MLGSKILDVLKFGQVLALDIHISLLFVPVVIELDDDLFLTPHRYPDPRYTSFATAFSLENDRPRLCF
jgi:hypothetical protein